MSKHKDLSTGAIHIVYNWTYADATARNADTSVTSNDVGKLARQLNDDTLWMLIDDTPTWVAVGGGGGGGDSIIKSLTNRTFGTVSQGDIVAISWDDASSFELPIAGAGASNQMLAVVTDSSIASGDDGNVCIAGFVSRINLTTTPSSIGAFVRYSSTPKQGLPRSPSTTVEAPDTGDFAMVLDNANDHPPAVIWNIPAQPVEKMLGRFTANLNTATIQGNIVCPDGKTCIITRAVVRSASTALIAVSFSMGWNASAYDDVIANATHTELVDNTVFTIIPAKIGAKVGTFGDTFWLKNNTLQGSAATCTVDVWGYFI